MNVKIIASAKNIPEIIAHVSYHKCEKIIVVMDFVPTKKTNTIAIKKTNTITTNVTSTASVNCHSKKARDLLYFAYSFISDISHITIDNYFYLLSLCKTRRYNIKWKLMNSEVHIKNRMCYYLDVIIK